MNGHLRSTTVLIQDMKVTLNDLQGVVWPSLKSFGVLFDMIFTDLTMEDTKKDDLFHSAKHNFNIFMKEKKFWSLLYQDSIVHLFCDLGNRKGCRPSFSSPNPHTM